MANTKVTQELIADDAIGADQLAASAVVTASIVDDNITQAKIADDAVGADQLAASAVVTASVVDANITTGKIADDAVTGAKIENAVTIATSATSPLMVATTSARITQQPLATSGTTISWNATTHANAYLVPAANLTIDNPSNPVEGAIISVEIAMNGTPRTIAWHANFEFAASTTPTATATANKTDIFSFRYNGSQWQEIGRVQNLAQT